MTINYTENLFETRYRDDYADSNGFVRILFNNGRHLQARELTQSQTIIQKQLERFGRNIFKEGADVLPGAVALNNKYEFVKLDAGVYSVPVDGSIIDETFVGQNSNVRVKVLEQVVTVGSDPHTLYVEYTNTIGGTVGDTPIRLTPGEDIVGVSTGTILRVQTPNTISNPAVGQGVKFSVDEGSFFVNGFFVFAPKQEIIIQKYSPIYSGTVGFKVVQDIVTEDDDESLYDNSQKLPNTTAPGADRFRITLTLIDEADTSANDTFVYLAKVVNSNVVDAVTGFNQYNKINDLIALRTKEESGNYLVRPFKILYDSADATNLNLNISDGTAYVNGYRVNKDYPTELEVPRAQDTEQLENEVVASNFGNYVIASTLTGLPDISTYAEVNLRDNATYGSGSNIGTARIRSIDRVGDGTYRIYLFNIAMSGGNNFRNVKSLGTSTINNATLLLENNLAVLKEANNIDLLFPLPQIRPSTINDISLTVQRKINAVTDGAGAVDLTLSAAGETWASTSDWITAVDSDGALVTPSISGSGTTTASVSGAPFNSNLTFFAYVNKSVGTVKQKLIQETTGNQGSLNTGGNGERYVDLAVPDAFQVNYIRQDSANGADISDQFNLDTGQRDAYYDISRLVLKGGIAVPTNVFWSIKHFQHVTSGDFFGINSYSSLSYTDVPSYTKQDGTVVDLRNVMDFRSVKNVGDTFVGGSGRIHELPKNTDVINSDITYYLPRYDKVIVDEQGELSVLQGISSLTPKFKEVSPNALELYRVKMNPFTLHDSDMVTQFIEAKGYTMKDIGLIEKRVNTLEKAVSLSLLELDTNALELIDSNGTPRTKSGFAVDNFTSHILSDTTNSEYKASINPSQQTLNSAYVEKNVGLVYDSSLSTNTVLKGDNVYVKYNETSYISQPQVSNTQSANPFTTSLYNGTVILSGASDEHRDTKTPATVVLQGGVSLTPKQELLYSFNEWGWNGVDRNSTLTTRVVENETIREVVNDRIVDVTLIPFMRSRKVYFKAVGLRPNTRIIPYFDGVNVSDWCKSEAFQRINTSKAEYGNTKSKLTSHPDGSSNLFTDAKGEVSGSFFIPNTPSIRFRTGVKEFTLLDITTFDPDTSGSIASASFAAEGVIETKTANLVNTRRVNPPNLTRKHNPLAQSFYVAETTGVFLTKIRLYFKNKSSTLPIWIQLRPMKNGAPSDEVIIPGSNKILDPINVQTSTDGSVGTDFEFDEPIYLNPQTEYALVVLTDASDYNLFISRMGEFELGSTEKRITKQPTLGSMFKPQSVADWEPSQLEDLMFVAYRASFSTGTSTAYLENISLPNKLLGDNPITTTSGSTEITVKHNEHGLFVGDTVTLSGIVGNIGGFSQDSLNANHVITAIDGTGYTFDMDSTASITTTSGGDDVIASEQMLMDKVFPYIETITPEETALQYKGKFHTGKSFAGNETAYAEDVIFTSLNNKEYNFFPAPKVVAQNSKETSLATSTAKMNVLMTTASEYVSPIVDLQRSSLTGISHKIDDQAAAPASGKNVPLNYVAETDPAEGSSLSKHITKPVTLIQDAVGLKVVFSANRPSVSTIEVYYKAITEDEDLNLVDWTLATIEAEVPSDENRDEFREYRYLVGGSSGSLSSFSVYQLKIVMKSTNSSKVPVIKDLRAIALGT